MVSVLVLASTVYCVLVQYNCVLLLAPLLLLLLLAAARRSCRRADGSDLLEKRGSQGDGSRGRSCPQRHAIAG